MAAFKKFDPRAALKKTKWNSDEILLPKAFVAEVAVVATAPSRNEKIENQNSHGTPATTATIATKSLGNNVSFSGFHTAFATLELGCPAYVEQNRWLVALLDGERFLKMWHRQAEALGWTVDELFGLHTPPANPAPNYYRMARY